MISFFLIGLVEMIICTAWTKVVNKSQVWASGAITLIEIIVWYYIIEAIISDINNWSIILAYALGCVLGTMSSTYYFQLIEKAERKFKRYKRKPSWKKLILSVLSW